MFLLHGEMTQQVVNDYNTFVFASGSFLSSGSASGSPVAGHVFAGIAYMLDAQPVPPAAPTNTDVVIEARDLSDALNPGTLYVRHKRAGVWQPWAVGGGSDKVAKAGDTMTGDLVVADATPSIVLNKTASGGSDTVIGKTAGLPRWIMYLGDQAAETGGNVGSDFVIARYSDAGTLDVPAPFSIKRNTGQTFINCTVASTSPSTGSLTVNGGLGVAGDAYVGSGLIAANITAKSGNLFIQALAGGNAQLSFLDETSTTKGSMLWSRAENFIKLQIPSGNFWVFGPGGVFQSNGYLSKSGVSGSYGTSAFNFNWTGSMQVWVDATNVGNMTISSDYRIKKDVINLPGMWDAVKALRPIKYTQAQFTPPAQIKANLEARIKYEERLKEGAETKPYEPPMPLFVADDIERWGFIAHELQDTLIPSAASGVRDSPDTIQSPNPFTLIAVLTKALQEAMTRIEALEARLA
jgi:hypothetical protein